MTSILQTQLSSPWLTKRHKDTNLYALVDSTKQKELSDNLPDESSEYISLFDTSDDFEMEKITPYIVRLKENSELKNWLIESWGEKESGFFFYSNCENIEVLYKHFLTFTEVTSTDSPTYFFNFYNPLSLNIWLESMPILSRLEFFKPIQSIVLESDIKDQIKVLELDIAGFLTTSEVLADNSTKEIKCYQNSLDREANQKTEKSLPWVLSEEEVLIMPKISRFNFMLKVTKKIWKSPSIQEKHDYKDLWEKVQSWTENLSTRNIRKRKDVALFLVLLAKYEKEWIKYKNEINIILANKQETSARIKYLDIRDIVALPKEGNQ